MARQKGGEKIGRFFCASRSGQGNIKISSISCLPGWQPFRAARPAHSGRRFPASLVGWRSAQQLVGFWGVDCLMFFLLPGGHTVDFGL